MRRMRASSPATQATDGQARPRQDAADGTEARPRTASRPIEHPVSQPASQPVSRPVPGNATQASMQRQMMARMRVPQQSQGQATPLAMPRTTPADQGASQRPVRNAKQALVASCQPQQAQTRAGWQQPAEPQVPTESAVTEAGASAEESPLSKVIGHLLTFSMTLSMILTPFAVLYSMLPNLMNDILSLPFLLLAPICLVYIVTMFVLGLRVAALFGCGPWYRLLTQGKAAQA